MKDQSKAYKKIVKSYLKEIKSALICSAGMKQAVLSTARQRIADLFPDTSTLSMEELCREIGTPEEIALGLESRSDIEQLKKKAKRYKIAKITCTCLLFVAIFIAVFLSFVIVSNNEYHIIFKV